MDKQRIYDAMLIKAFRKDVRMAELAKWLKPYQINLDDCGFKRVPKHVFYPGRVQEMVGRYLKPLADRLWDTSSIDDIKTLDWMANLNCEYKETKWDKEKRSLIKQSNHDRRRGGMLKEAIEKNKRNNQWGIVK